MTLRLEDISWDGLFPQSTSAPNLSPFGALHQGRNVLITGAGGSIGAALSRVVHQLHPATLLLLDSSEQNLYYIHRELAASALSCAIVPVIGSVADNSCVTEVFRRYRPQLVYHAAALKHVPLGEMNPFAVVENNVFGTWRTVEAAVEFDAASFILISTDKSVNPSSIMGASKRLAELIVQGKSSAKTRMTSIRLGNVLGSEGSVVPLFLGQIARGGPVTVTDPNAERYFLTIEETIARILSAVADCPAEPSITVPMLGNPVRIADLAHYLIRQAGAKNVEVAFTGLRPGDKMREEFVAAGESVMREASGLRWLRTPGLAASQIHSGLALMQEAVSRRNLPELLETLTRLVPDYQPTEYLRSQISAAARL